MAAPALWHYPIAFAGFRVGHTLSLVVGEQEQALTLSGQIVWMETETIALELELLPYQAGIVAPETVVGILRPGGYYELARIAGRDVAETVVITLHPVPVAPPPASARPPRPGPIARKQRGGQRRAARRVALGQPWEAHVAGISGRRALRIRVAVLDLSVGGAQIQSRHPLPDDGRLSLHLTPADGSARMELPLRVAWQGPHEAGAVSGVQFLPLSDALSAELERLVFRLRWRSEKSAVETV